MSPPALQSPTVSIPPAPATAGEIPPGSAARTAPPHPSSASGHRAGHSVPPRTTAFDGFRQTTPSTIRAPPARRYTRASSEFDSFASAGSDPLTWGSFVFMQQSRRGYLFQGANPALVRRRQPNRRLMDVATMAPP